MKKNSLLKSLLIMYVAIVVLSWFVPAGVYSNGQFSNSGVAPVGLINLFRIPVMTFQTFIQYTIVFLSIGILYGVLNKTGVYDNILKGIAKKWKGKEKLLIILTSILFALIGSLTGLSTFAFLLVPFVAAILLLSGYDKMSALLATIGALLIGEVASVFGFSGAGYIINVFNLKMFDEIITRIILFVILTGLYVFFIAKKTKVQTKKEENIPFLVVDSKNNKKKLPLVIVSVLFILLALVGMYNWYYGFGIEVFNNLDAKVQGITWLSRLLNGITALGYWGNYEFAIAIVIFTFVIAWLYNIKLKDLADGVKEGFKEMLPIALYATICNIIFTVMLLSSSNMYATIVNALGTVKSTFNLPIASLISLSGSIFYNDFYYMLTNCTAFFAGYEAAYYPVLGVLVTGIYGLAMMVLPTSIVLVAGLKYFDISYTEWLKRMWKYLLCALAILLLIVLIVAALI